MNVFKMLMGITFSVIFIITNANFYYIEISGKKTAYHHV